MVDIPQLVVALNDMETYVHIKEVRESENYRCPCCNAIVKPRAYKKDKDYEVQPHFYHVNGECDTESRIHWLYKNWLFEVGSKFIIDGQIHEVKETKIEEIHKTSFGDYKPDITIYTEDEVIYFEMNFSSAKSGDDYLCKWCELDNKVVEVDLRKLMNSNYGDKIPEFNLIYSDGICHKKEYKRKDSYSPIAERKMEWKRQDMLNYKIKWEKLDWFWIELCKLKNKKASMDDVIESFKAISIEDKELCFDILKKQSCMKGYKDTLRDIINAEIIEFCNYNHGENLKKLIPYNISFNTIMIIPRDKIYFSYNFKNKYEHSSHTSVYSKKWCLKFTDVLSCVDNIKKSAEYYIKNEEDYMKIREQLLEIKQSMNGSIWYIKYEEGYPLYYSIRGKIGIKNHWRDFQYRDLYININSFNVENMKKIITKYMNEIYNDVNRYEGDDDSEYRHVFVAGGSKLED